MTSRIPLVRFLLPLLFLVILIGWMVPADAPEASMYKNGYTNGDRVGGDPLPTVEDDGDAPPDTLNSWWEDGDPDDLEHMDGDEDSPLRTLILLLVSALRL